MNSLMASEVSANMPLFNVHYVIGDMENLCWRYFPWTDLDTIMLNVRLMEMSKGDYE